MLTDILNFFWNAHWDKWVAIATVASAIITAVSIVIAAWALLESKKSNQLQTFWDIFNDVQTFEKEFYAEYADAEAEKQRNWALPLFNRIEFIAFLLNHNMLPKQNFLDFYRDFLLQTHEIFLKLSTPNEQADPKLYTEYKKLIGQLNKSK